MRLYNAESCTPVVTSCDPTPKKTKKWVATKGANPANVPWGQEVLKKNRYLYREETDVGKSHRDGEEIFPLMSKATASSFQDAFDPFDFSDDVEDGNWNSVGVFQLDGSPVSNKGSIRTSSTSSTGDLTPDVGSDFHAGISSNTVGSRNDAVGIKQFFQAKAKQACQEKKLILSSSGVSVGALTDDSSLTSSSTFCTTSSDSEDEAFVDSPHPAKLQAFEQRRSACGTSPTGSPRSYKPTERGAMPGFPMFDIDSASDASDFMSDKSFDREATKSTNSKYHMEESATSTPAKPKVVACELDTRFRGVSTGSTSSRKKPAVAPSFVPKKQADHDDDELLTVRARLKKVTTNRGGPFRAHSGVSPPPKKEKRSVVVLPDSFSPISKFKHTTRGSEGQDYEGHLQNKASTELKTDEVFESKESMFPPQNQLLESDERAGHLQSAPEFESIVFSVDPEPKNDVQNYFLTPERRVLKDQEEPVANDSFQAGASQNQLEPDRTSRRDSPKLRKTTGFDNVQDPSTAEDVRDNLSDMLRRRGGHSEELSSREEARTCISNLLLSRQMQSPATVSNFAQSVSTNHSVPEIESESVGVSNPMKSHSSSGTGLDSGFRQDSSKDVTSAEQASSLGVSHGAPTVPLKEDPKYTKFFTMLKRGVPMGAVQHAMQREGLDPIVLNGDHGAPAPSTGNKKSDNVGVSTPRDTHRRVRLHWHTHDNVQSGTVWSLLVSDPNLFCDEIEFKELFEAELNSPVKAAPVASKGDEVVVKVIDPKRANNGGIILATIRLSYRDMAEAVNAFDVSAFTPEQIRGIIQLLPTADETKLLKNCLSQKLSTFEGLCECEKFMATMMNVPHAKRKLDALLFMQRFSSTAEELRKDAHLVQRACEEIVSSVQLRKVLGAVLDIGNRLNSAGPSTKKKADAITLDSLLMLSQAKAFDKKTTFLQYVGRILLKSGASATRLKDEIASVFKAQKVYWDFSVAELGRLENELENLRKIALSHGDQASNIEGSSNENQRSDDDTLSDKSLELGLEEETVVLESTSVGRFTLEACLEVADIVEIVESCKQKHEHLLRYFGEEDKQDELRSHEVFQIMATFCKNFEEAIACEKRKLKPVSKSRANEYLGSPGLASSSCSDTVSVSPSKKNLRGNMGAVINEMRHKSKKKMRWGRKKR